MKRKQKCAGLVVLCVMLFCTVIPVFGGTKSEVYKSFTGLAIRGYDPVAFFTEAKPAKGSKDFDLEWKGAKWRFASEENRNLFQTAPEKYAPQYGGYCAWAVAEGYTASVKPDEAWNIVDGKLYLNYDAKIAERWREDIPGFIQKADANWPGVLE